MPVGRFVPTSIDPVRWQKHQVASEAGPAEATCLLQALTLRVLSGRTEV